jgi:hypothetical protein
MHNNCTPVTLSAPHPVAAAVAAQNVKCQCLLGGQVSLGVGCAAHIRQPIKLWTVTMAKTTIAPRATIATVSCYNGSELLQWQ